MSATVRLWCRCGVAMTARANLPDVAERIGEAFRRGHVGDGHEVSDDAATGRRWRAAARRRESEDRRSA
jgi:hypothetical protein